MALAVAPLPAQEPPNKATPQQRAIDFLAREVPRWPMQHGCFSCHNNGDGARALYTASKLGYQVPAAALRETSRWLARPQDWQQSVGNADFKDERLARLQFVVALAAAVEAGEIRDKQAGMAAAELIVKDQQPDGSWPLDAGGVIGSPVTYGRTLGTVLARRALQATDAAGFHTSIAAAGAWIRAREPKTVLDAAAVLWALADDRDVASLRESCVQIIRKGAATRGGWGPYVNSPPETFDTAVVLLAINAQPQSPELQLLVSRGRQFLIDHQLPDGGWAETTRPRGAESYAQRISTTGWCTLALLATSTTR